MLVRQKRKANERRVAMKTDCSLRREVLAALERDPSLPAEAIGVSVHDEVVCLHGWAETSEQVTCAERLTRLVPGVRALISEIEVGLGSTTAEFGDRGLARSIRNEFKLKPHLGFDRIFVKVGDRIVTLEGEVNWRYQIKLAEQYVLRTGGTKGVVNLLQARHDLKGDAMPLQAERVAV